MSVRAPIGGVERKVPSTSAPWAGVTRAYKLSSRAVGGNSNCRKRESERRAERERDSLRVYETVRETDRETDRESDRQRDSLRVYETVRERKTDRQR